MSERSRLYDDFARSEEQGDDRDEKQDSRGATATYASLIAYLARRHAFETHIDNQDSESKQHQEEEEEQQQGM